MVRFFKFLSIGVMASFLAACASNSVFVSYPHSIKPVLADVNKGNIKQAQETIAPDLNSQDSLLYLMEYGRLQQLAGDHAGSLATFTKAIDMVDANTMKAKITVTGSTAQMASLLVNDNVIPYTGTAYEHVLLHHYQALNYLSQSDLEGALVEVRRADRAQQQEQDLHQAQINDAEQTARAKNIATLNQDDNAQFRAMNLAAASIKSQFFNAYTYYLGAVLYEASGDMNSAYVDYKKALALSPNNHYLQQKTLLLAKQLGMSSDLNHYQRLYPELKVNDLNRKKAQVVVLFEQNFIPPKTQFSLPIPIPATGIVNITLPIYEQKAIPTPPMQVLDDQNHFIGNTEPLLNLQALAARALKEQYPIIVTREVLRTLAKVSMEYTATHNNNNALLAIFTSVYAVVTSGADLRSWSTLPNDAQIFQAYLDPGTQILHLQYNGQSQSVTLHLRAGGTTLLWVVTYPNSRYVQTFTL